MGARFSSLPVDLQMHICAQLCNESDLRIVCRSLSKLLIVVRRPTDAALDAVHEQVWRRACISLHLTTVRFDGVPWRNTCHRTLKELSVLACERVDLFREWEHVRQVLRDVAAAPNKVVCRTQWVHRKCVDLISNTHATARLVSIRPTHHFCNLLSLSKPAQQLFLAPAAPVAVRPEIDLNAEDEGIEPYSIDWWAAVDESLAVAIDAAVEAQKRVVERRSELARLEALYERKLQVGAAARSPEPMRHQLRLAEEALANEEASVKTLLEGGAMMQGFSDGWVECMKDGSLPLLRYLVACVTSLGMRSREGAAGWSPHVEGQTELMRAAALGRLDLVKLLMAHTAGQRFFSWRVMRATGVSRPEYWGQSAIKTLQEHLDVAFPQTNNDAELAEYLADVERPKEYARLTDAEGRTALTIATVHGHMKVADYLQTFAPYDAPQIQRAFENFCSRGWMNDIQRLFDTKMVDVNGMAVRKYAAGRANPPPEAEAPMGAFEPRFHMRQISEDDSAPPLLRAIAENRVPAAKFLLEHGAAIEHPSYYERPLILALQHQLNIATNDVDVSPSFAMVSLLLDHKADVHQTSLSEPTMCPLQCAACFAEAGEDGIADAEHIFCVLLKAGAPPDGEAPERNTKTPLAIVCDGVALANPVPVARLLLASRADPNGLWHPEARPPLINACRSWPSLVLPLLRRKADPNVVVCETPFGATYLRDATFFSNYRPTGPLPRDPAFFMPLICAVERGNAVTVDLLLQGKANPECVLSNHGGKSMPAALHCAVVKKQAACLDSLLRSCTSKAVNERDLLGNTLLLLACRTNDRACCNVLLKHKANVTLCNNDSQSPLHALAASPIATAADRTLIVMTARSLLDQGAKINRRCREGSTPLSLAVCHANLELVTFLIDKSDGTLPHMVAVEHDRHRHSGTLLSYAHLFLKDVLDELEGHREIYNLLSTLARGRMTEIVETGLVNYVARKLALTDPGLKANVNEVTEVDGCLQGPLFSAINSGQGGAMTDLLLDHHADPDGHLHARPLIAAIRQRMPLHRDTLLEQGACATVECNAPLRTACKSLDVDAVNSLLAYKADPNAIAFEGCGPSCPCPRPRPAVGRGQRDTLMHMLCVQKKLSETPSCEILTALVNAHGDINATNSGGHTPLCYAIENNRIELVRTCLTLRADLGPRTVRQHAAIDGGFNQLAMLMNQEAWTPLMMAVALKRVQCVELLVKDSNVATTGETTAWSLLRRAYSMPAKNRDRVRIARALASKGGHDALLRETVRSGSAKDLAAFFEKHPHCFVDGQDNLGHTALHAAVTRNMLHAVVTLLRHDADPTLKTHYGNTALHLSIGLQSNITKELLRYGADPDVPNPEGKRPRQLAEARVARFRARGGPEQDNAEKQLALFPPQ